MIVSNLRISVDQLLFGTAKATILTELFLEAHDTFGLLFRIADVNIKRIFQTHIIWKVRFKIEVMYFMVESIQTLLYVALVLASSIFCKA